MKLTTLSTTLALAALSAAAVLGSGPAQAPDNGLARTPPMGWNSWNHFYGDVTDADVRAAADAMVSSGMKQAGYTYINIDDTWEAARDAQGNIRTNEKFPNMRALSDYVHKKGLKIGIYSSPGPTTCAGYPGSYDHEAQDAKTYAAWGIDYLKYDWCSAGQKYPHTLDGELDAYGKMGAALRAAGRAIVYSLCQYGDFDVWKWGPNIGGNSWRTTGDINDTWKRMVQIGFNQSDIAPYAAPGHWNDPDMLEVGNGGMTDTEYRTHFSLWCLLAAPLLAGNDLSKMSPATLAILTNKEAIAVNQDRGGVQGHRVHQDGDLEVWVKPLRDGSKAVGLFNRGEAAADVTAQWADLGLPATSHVKVRDLWAHQDKGDATGSYTANVPPHGVVFVRLH